MKKKIPVPGILFISIKEIKHEINSLIKKLFFVLPVCSLVFSSCRKSATPTIDVQVKEAGTGAPVAGANVILQRCADWGCVFGVIVEYNGTTNENGICTIPQNKWDRVTTSNDDLRITKSGYWGEAFSKSTSVSLIPAGWIRMRMVKQNNYPQGSYLNISLSSQITPAGAIFMNSSSYLFKAAADSTVVMMAFGNQSNKLNWRVTSGGTVLGGGERSLQVPGQGTINVTVNY